MDGQIEKQNSMMEVYLWVFVNFEQNDWARLFSMAKFAYNNAKNASTSYILFEINCGYYSCIFYKQDQDFYSKLKITEKLFFKL